LSEIVATGNLLIDNLAAPIRARVVAAATPIALKIRDSIYAAGQPVDFAYFPIDGFISNVVTMHDGEAVEVGVIGREGMAGINLTLFGATSATTLYTQIAGDALRVPRDEMLEIIAGMEPPSLFAAYVEAQFGSLAQYAACNRLHTIDQRFARWLLMAHDRVAGDEIGLTQEFLALMLGVRRPGVTVAAAALQRAGLIANRRGRIVLSDRTGVEAAACECYRAVENRFGDLLGYSISKSSPFARV
jgi:CRP-like cAMP-binding protein